MKMTAVFLLSLFSENVFALSAMDFLNGRNEKFNRVFVQRFVGQAIELFASGERSADFDAELKFFIENESDALFFKGPSEKLKTTKFFIRFRINKSGTQKIELIFVSKKKRLGVWNLNGFKREGYTEIDGVQENCKSHGAVFYEFSKGGECSSYTPKLSMSHPAFKGYLDVRSSGQSKSLAVVKYLLVGMVRYKVPDKVKNFALKWRTPPSKFLNQKEYSNVYIP